MNCYTAKKVSSEMTVDDARWLSADEASLDYVWAESFPSPYTTKARAVHSDSGITVLLTTDEWPIRVTAMSHGDTICDDSCMEMFFTPNSVDRDYMNFEINPAGVALTAIGEKRNPGRRKIDIRTEGVKIESKIIPESGWSVMLYIPYTFLLKHFSACEKIIRANFTKCGNLTVRKHYSTWNPIPTPAPDYHRPEYFGEIHLSDETI